MRKPSIILNDPQAHSLCSNRAFRLRRDKNPESALRKREQLRHGTSHTGDCNELVSVKEPSGCLPESLKHRVVLVSRKPSGCPPAMSNAHPGRWEAPSMPGPPAGIEVISAAVPMQARLGNTAQTQRAGSRFGRLAGSAVRVAGRSYPDRYSSSTGLGKLRPLPLAHAAAVLRHRSRPRACGCSTASICAESVTAPSR